MLRRERGFGLLSPKAQISLSLCCHPNWLKDPWHGSDELIYCRQLVFVNACFATRIRVLSRHHAGHTVDFNGPCSFKPRHCNGQHFQLPFKERSHVPAAGAATSPLVILCLSHRWKVSTASLAGVHRYEQPLPPSPRAMAPPC